MKELIPADYDKSLADSLDDYDGPCDDPTPKPSTRLPPKGQPMPTHWELFDF